MFASFPEHIAGYHVFRRLSMPRHPPYTLSSLTTFIDHRLPAGRAAAISSTAREKIDNVPPEMPLHFRYRQKRYSTTSVRNRPCLHPSPDGKTKKHWTEVAEVYFAINLEPHIHFSKSLLPGKIPDKNPAERGSVRPELSRRTDPNSTANQPQRLGLILSFHRLPRRLGFTTGSLREPARRIDWECYQTCFPKRVLDSV